MTVHSGTFMHPYSPSVYQVNQRQLPRGHRTHQVALGIVYIRNRSEYVGNISIIPSNDIRRGSVAQIKLARTPQCDPERGLPEICCSRRQHLASTILFRSLSQLHDLDRCAVCISLAKADRLEEGARDLRYLPIAADRRSPVVHTHDGDTAAPRSQVCFPEPCSHSLEQNLLIVTNCADSSN